MPSWTRLQRGTVLPRAWNPPKSGDTPPVSAPIPVGATRSAAPAGLRPCHSGVPNCGRFQALRRMFRPL
eukprot:9467462-Alexandrium_andersonii.AAC.1